MSERSAVRTAFRPFDLRRAVFAQARNQDLSQLGAEPLKLSESAAEREG